MRPYILNQSPKPSTLDPKLPRLLGVLLSEGSVGGLGFGADGLGSSRHGLAESVLPSFYMRCIYINI